MREGVPRTKVRFWHDQLFCKPSKYGGNVAWHQVREDIAWFTIQRHAYFPKIAIYGPHYINQD